MDTSMHAQVVSLDDVPESEILVHDEKNDRIALLLASLEWQPQGGTGAAFPVPLGVLRAVERPCYEQRVAEQIEAAKAKRPGDFDSLFASGDTWVVN